MAIEIKRSSVGESTGEIHIADWLESEGVATEESANEGQAGAAATQSEAQEVNAENEALPQPGAKSMAERNEEIVPMTMLRRIEAKDPIEANQQTTINTAFKEVDMITRLSTSTMPFYFCFA